jgi:hypothetical protein
LDSWLAARPSHVSDQFHLVPEPVQLVDEHDLGRLLEAIRELPDMPVLVVLDTLARCFTGGEENSAKDMGKLVDAADQIRRLTGGTVLIVHHTGKDGSLRGSTALLGAVSTMVTVKKGKDGLTVFCAKQKDGEEFEAIRFQLKQVGASCVLEPVGRAPAQADCLKPGPLACLSALKSGGLRYGEWKKAGGPPGSFNRNREALIEGEFVVQSRNIYELTEQGRAVLGGGPGQSNLTNDQDDVRPSGGDAEGAVVSRTVPTRSASSERSRR